MKIVALICRILLGLLFVVFGLNGFLHFIPMGTPPPAGSIPGNFMSSLMASGWMHFVSACQVIGGVLVLIGGTTPLGLLILGPVIVNILLFHLLMTGGHGIVPGAVAALLEILLIYAYRVSFAGIFTTKAAPPV